MSITRTLLRQFQNTLQFKLTFKSRSNVDTLKYLLSRKLNDNSDLRTTSGDKYWYNLKLLNQFVSHED